MEQKVQENQKLKESVDNEKELWKNKANNLKRNSATQKPEFLHKYNNCPSPERKTNLIANSNNKESVISAYNNSKNLNNPQSTNEKSLIVANKREAIDRSVPGNINRDSPRNTISNNNYNNSNSQNLIAPIANSANKSINKSAISEDNESDYEDNNQRLNAKKVNNKKIVVSDINSDVEGLSQK